MSLDDIDARIITALIKDLGANGLVGLITLGIIVWLFANRSLA